MTVPVSALQEIAPGAIIELFRLELNTAQHGTNDVFRFHAGTNLNNNANVYWAGEEYLAFPIEADGFDYSGNGQLPRPKIRVSNILSTITALILTLPDGLEGAKVTRIRTLARYIDTTNFPSTIALLAQDGSELITQGGGLISAEATNPFGTPDPTAEFPREIYYVDRKTVENRDIVEFELAAAFDLAGISAPKRKCVANICQWVYRSTECGYNPVAPAAQPLREHYAVFGYSEGRNINSSGQFNATYYLAAYADVAAIYTLATANEHFRNYGIWEGKMATLAGNLMQAITLVLIRT